MKLKPILVLIVLIMPIYIHPFLNVNCIDNDQEMMETSAPSIILMIGDGMGFNHVRLGQLAEVGGISNLSMVQTNNQFSVYTKNVYNFITDSAAAATAIATGVKTSNGKIAQTKNGDDLETILEIAQDLGKKTGVVTTTTIQHATPACFMTHVNSRSSYDEITSQIVNDANVDIIIGGGLDYFSAEQLLTMKSNGYQYITNKTAFDNYESGKLLALFSGSHLPYEQNRNLTVVPSLANITAKTLNSLNDAANGFFLVIEGGRIDHASHDNNEIRAGLEVIAFEHAVRQALQYLKEHTNTILLITADHETGDLSITNETVTGEKPVFGNTEDENRTLLENRLESVGVNWGRSGHSAQEVPLYCFGDYFGDNDSGYMIDNTEIFNIMNQFLANNTITVITPYNISLPESVELLFIVTIVFALSNILILRKKKKIKGF